MGQVFLIINNHVCFVYRGKLSSNQERHCGFIDVFRKREIIEDMVGI